MHDVFYAQTKFRLKIPFLGVQCTEFVCFAAQMQFCCEDD